MLSDAKESARYRLSLRVLADRPAPNNICNTPVRIEGDDTGVLIALITQIDTLSIKNTSVCLGHLVNPKKDWWRPGAEAPDGSYALLRSDGPPMLTLFWESIPEIVAVLHEKGC